MVWPQADRTEDPVLRPGLRPECFQGPAPAQIVGEIFGGDTMEAAHPFFEPSVIGIHVVDVKIGHLRAGLARGRQDVDRDRSLEGEGDDGGAAIAAERKYSSELGKVPAKPARSQLQNAMPD